MKTITKTTVTVVFILITAITTFILWANGMFWIVDRQTSPNGNITTTVYNKNLTDFIPKTNGFTIKTSGDFNGRRICIDGSEFEQLWWSQDSNYQVISTIYDDNRLLELTSYAHNNVSNLSFLINSRMSNYNEFTDLMKGEADWDSLQFEFGHWKEEQGDMVVNFNFIDYTGKKQTGQVDFNCNTGDISNIHFN